jgi:hypothetical protein
MCKYLDILRLAWGIYVRSFALRSAAGRGGNPRVPCQWRFLLLEKWTSDLNSVSRFLTKHNVTVLPHPPYSLISPVRFFFCFHDWKKKKLKGRQHENIEAKRLRRWSPQAFRKRHSPAAFRTCRNAGNSVITVEGTTSKGTGSISCEAEFCIFYRLSLRTLWTKDVPCYHKLICLA